MGREITRVSSLILKAAQEQLPVAHPDYPGVGISISQLYGPTDDPNADIRNAVTVASGDVDFDNPSTWIYGYSNLVLDPTDPFTEGFTIGDIWG